jgi:hypothetical protein
MKRFFFRHSTLCMHDFVSGASHSIGFLNRPPFFYRKSTEAFNVFNRVRLGTGSTSLQAQNFGVLTVMAIR